MFVVVLTYMFLMLLICSLAASREFNMNDLTIVFFSMDLTNHHSYSLMPVRLLQSDIAALQKSRTSLTDELVNISRESERLKEEVQDIPQLTTRLNVCDFF